MAINKIKAFLIDLQLKLMSQGRTRRYIRDIAQYSSSPLPRIKNAPGPYELGGHVAEQSCYDNAIFVTSRFRSGSTLLWNIFRQADCFTAYYEPFNERQWFLKDFRGGHVDSTHRGVNGYWEEYTDLGELSQFYREDWIRHRLLMNGRDSDPNMRAYIDCLIERAERRPVLQFNRIDFRLDWIKANYPAAKLVHLYRNPRDQWCSFLTDHELMNKEDVEQTYVDNFYLDIWCEDLAIHYPFLDKQITSHPYQRFYYLWKLSYLFGKHYSDFSISFEDLTGDPEPNLTELFSIIGMDNPPLDKLCSLIDAPKSDKWKMYAESLWFEALEDECECQLNRFLTDNNVANGPV